MASVYPYSPYNYQAPSQNYTVNPYQYQYQYNPFNSSNYQTNLNGYQSINVVWIENDSDVANYAVGPNSAVLLWNFSGGKIFLKSADSTGKPSVKTYTVKEDGPSSDESANVKDIPVGFVKEDDFLNLKSVLEELKEDMDAVKKDMYGFAGKKRAKGKEEE